MQNTNKAYSLRKIISTHTGKCVGHIVAICLFVPLLLLTVASAYGGMANPAVRPWISILAMTFPVLISISGVSTLLFIFLRFKIEALCGIIAILICIPALLSYSPVHIFKTREGHGNDEFTLMTWNILWWYPYYDKDAQPTPNPDMQAILDADPDVLVLQESYKIMADTLGVTKEQFDEFSKRYKYSYANRFNDILTLYSRYPFTCRPEESNSGRDGYIKYTLDIQGRSITLFNVHLHNVRLSADDIGLYNTLVTNIPEKSVISQAKNVLGEKLTKANQSRAKEAQTLREVLDNTKGNVIVCGDFNDIPNSYTLRTIKGEDLTDAYAQSGFGPGITYRSHKMFFRIDHVLYRGNFVAVDAQRLKIGQSDHYPILTTFRWKNDKNDESSK